MAQRDADYLKQAIALAYANIAEGGRPFGAVITRGGSVLATGVNTILQSRDPTGHAEMNAIRAASKLLRSPDLSDTTVYASGQPCPMCLAAMRMAGVRRVVFAHSNADAEPYGLSSAAIAADLALPLDQQSMTITHMPERLVGEPELYAEWRHHRDGH